MARLCNLALSLLLLFSFVAGTARADGLILLPTGPIPSDGVSPVTLQLWGAGVDTAVKVRIKPTSGQLVAAPSVSADGLITFQYLPPAVTSATSDTLAVRLRGATLRADETVTLPLVPAYGGTVGIELDPPAWSPGTAGVTYRLRATPGPQADASRHFLVRASSGQIDTPISTGDGVHTGRWAPTGEFDGQLGVLLTVADAAAPDRILGWGVIPILAHRSLSFNVPAGSSNLLTAGDRQFGPIPASPAGTVAFDLELPPSITQGTLQTIGPGSANTSTTVELASQGDALLDFIPLPSAVPADASQTHTISIVATQPGGAPWTQSAPTITVDAGTLGAVSPSSVPGVFQTTWTPSAQVGVATFTAQLGERKATTDVRLLPSLPVVSLSTDPPQLTLKQRDLNIQVLVKDPHGTALPGRSPSLWMAGAGPIGRTVDHKDGSYTLKARTKSPRAVIYAEPPVKASGMPPAHVVIWPMRTATTVDGQLPVAIAVTDCVGLPVPDVELTLSVPAGDGTLPPSARTGREGVARVDLKLGPTPGPITLHAVGAGIIAESAVWSTAPGVTAPALQPTGTQADAALALRWMKAAPMMQVAREAPAVVASAAPVRPAAAPTATAAPASAAQPTVAPATGPASTPATAPAAQKLSPRTTAGASTRLSGTLASIGHVYQASAKAGQDVPSDAAFENGNLFGGSPFGAMGLGIHGLMWPGGGTIGLDAEARTWFDRLSAANDDMTVPSWDLMVGARYRSELSSNLHWYGLAQAHRSPALVFVYADSAKTGVNVESVSLYGLRGGGGLTYDSGPVWADLQVAETFVPLPIDTSARLTIDVEVKPDVFAELGLDLDFRRLQVDAFGDEVDIVEQQQAIRLGLTRVFR